MFPVHRDYSFRTKQDLLSVFSLFSAYSVVRFEDATTEFTEITERISRTLGRSLDYLLSNVHAIMKVFDAGA